MWGKEQHRMKLMIDRKTTRKNKTKQIVNWPAKDGHFTIKDLVALNPHMLTSATPPSDITLRVRLSKAIAEDHTITEIGSKNMNKGRPIKVFAFTPVNPKILDRVRADGIILNSNPVPVIQINPSTSVTISTPASDTNITTPTVKA